MSAGSVAGTRLCTLADLAATGAKGVTIGVWPDARDIVVVRDGSAIRAYANRCPHLQTTLETRPDRFLDETGEHLVCSTHGARFRVGDGLCLIGPCEGDRLEPMPIEVRDGEVRLANV